MTKIQYSWMQNEKTIHKVYNIIFNFLVWAVPKFAGGNVLNILVFGLCYTPKYLLQIYNF